MSLRVPTSLRLWTICVSRDMTSGTHSPKNGGIGGFDCSAKILLSNFIKFDFETCSKLAKVTEDLRILKVLTIALGPA